MSGYPAIIMGLLSLIGGSMGYARKGSLPSLLGGISVGVLFIVSGFALRQNRGYRGALAASVLLLCSSLPRVSKGPVPAVLSVLGTLLTAYYGNAYFKKAGSTST